VRAYVAGKYANASSSSAVSPCCRSWRSSSVSIYPAQPDSVGPCTFSPKRGAAYADRNLYIADPDFVKAPARGPSRIRYLASRRETDRSETFHGQARAGNPAGGPRATARRTARAPATSHVSIVDARQRGGLTRAWKPRSQPPDARFLLNNELTDFSWVPEEDGKPSPTASRRKSAPRSMPRPWCSTKRESSAC